MTHHKLTSLCEFSRPRQTGNASLLREPELATMLNSNQVALAGVGSTSEYFAAERQKQTSGAASAALSLSTGYHAWSGKYIFAKILTLFCGE
jgi:hypothetical protein